MTLPDVIRWISVLVLHGCKKDFHINILWRCIYLGAYIKFTLCSNHSLLKIKNITGTKRLQFPSGFSKYVDDGSVKARLSVAIRNEIGNFREAGPIL